MPKQIPLAVRQHRIDWAAWYTDKTLYDPRTLQPSDAPVELQWFQSSKRRGVYISVDRMRRRHSHDMRFPFGVFQQVQRLALMTREQRDQQAGSRAADQLMYQMAGELLDCCAR